MSRCSTGAWAPPGATSFNARRFARQEAGECTYLVAWPDGRPVGHTELRWVGCAAPEVTLDCPEIGGLAVWPEELVCGKLGQRGSTRLSGASRGSLRIADKA